MDGALHTASQRRQARRRKPITGTRAAMGKLKGAPEPSRDLFVYRVDKLVTDEDISSYLSDNGVEVRAIKLVSNSESRFASFKVELKVSDINKVLASDFWPEGICVRRFYTRRAGNQGNENEN